MDKKKFIPNNTGKTYHTTAKQTTDVKVANFKRLYLDAGNEETFCNIYRAAVGAGYSHTYAANLTNKKNCPKWWTEFQEESGFMRANMLAKAEKNINQTLTKKEKDATDTKLKHDASKFVSERLGKTYYSTRQELTSKDGKRLFTISKESEEEKLGELFAGVEPVPVGKRKE